MPAITKLSDDELEEILDANQGEEPEEMIVSINTPHGELHLPVAMLMDKDGNPTEILFDARVALAGSAETGWFEIDIQAGTWLYPTFH